MVRAQQLEHIGAQLLVPTARAVDECVPFVAVEIDGSIETRRRAGTGRSVTRS